jgi:SAM-dependent methyltransferase
MGSGLTAYEAGAPWMTILKRCQDEISILRPHPYYLAAYRQQEYFYWQHIPRWIYQDALDRTPQKCLDIGCAYGTLLLYVKMLSGCEAFGLDFVDLYISPVLLEKYQLHFYVNNIELDQFPWNAPFDTIIFTEVLEHFNFYPVPTLQKIGSILSDYGRLYLSTPDAAKWGQTTRYYPSYKEMPLPSADLRHQVVDDHVWQFSEDELRKILDDAGLEILRFDLAQGYPHGHFNLTLQKK